MPAPGSGYRHTAEHVKRVKKRTAKARSRVSRRLPPPGAEIVYHPYATYIARNGKRRVAPDTKDYYQVIVNLRGRYRLLYSTHREPYHLHLSVTYDVDDLAVFRTKQAAINAAWRVFHQDEEWRSAVDQSQRGGL